MYGSQADLQCNPLRLLFEKDVNMYGSQAQWCFGIGDDVFEKDVNMYGSQAVISTSSSAR